MRRVLRVELPEPVAADLRRRQADADIARASNTLEVTTTWAKARRSARLKEVLDALERMAGDRARCMYCLDSHGTDIEHFWPKTPYPARMFEWPNLLLGWPNAAG